MDNIKLEKFYVYRGLNNDESWGTVVLDGDLRRLPNVSFGMRVFAINETEAITRAKKEYDKVHAHDSDKENIRRFAAAALKSVIGTGDHVVKRTMEYAIDLNDKYIEHFKRIEDEKVSTSDEGASRGR